jgi:DNA modification methylase
MDKLQIRYEPIDKLIPYAKNSRTHSEDQIVLVAASIQDFGFTNPILVDGDKGIIAGHGRLLAAQKLKMKEVPVIELGHLTPVQRQAYVIADNQLAVRAGWDTELLRLELGDLAEQGFDLELLGFEADLLASMLAPLGTDGATDPDAVVEPPVEPISVLGDVWTMGRHRLICGDSTNLTDVEKVLGGVQPHLMVTDPPYGVDYDPAWRNEAAAKGTIKRSIGKTATGKVLNDSVADWKDAWALFQGDVAYVWSSDKFAYETVRNLIDSGFEVRSQIIWAKGKFVISQGHYHPQHEPCWYLVRKGQTGHWGGDRKQTTLWNIEHNKSETGHGTQKPVECMRRPILNNSSPGQAVYEPFCGSGTTIIAAEMEGRTCYALELSPAYVDVAVQRWEKFTQKVATNQDGKTLEQLKGERCIGSE